MLEDFLSYIVEELSVKKTDKLLLAVSGGVDSMVMVDLFRQTDVYFEVAHINHSTRDGASDSDAMFLQNYCTTNKIVFHSIKLDYASLAEGNFQQNARKARYRFFDSVMKKSNLTYLATAHHMDDRWETFIMNLNRKSGIRGLTSLKPKRDHVIRPLMNLRKKKIEAYALEHKIPFVKDISNDSDDYTRNKIRHNISNIAEEIIPEIINNANQAISNLSNTDLMIQELVQTAEIIKTMESTGYCIVDLQMIKEFNTQNQIAHYVLSPFGFTNSSIYDMMSCNNTGALFFSHSHEALYDRGKIIIRPKEEQIKVHLKLVSPGKYFLQDGRELRYEKFESGNSKAGVLYLDSSKYTNNEITVRSIQPGDRYYPSHMNGKSKSLKKHLTDLKIDRFSKAKILVVKVDQKIVKLLY